MSMQVNIHQAKTQLSRLLQYVMEGHEVVIAKAGRPVARLVPIPTDQPQRIPGSAEGKVVIAPDFDEPLPEDVLKAFEEGWPK